jgi:hypothetical protein
MMAEKPHDKTEPVSEETLDEYLDGESPVSAAYRELDPVKPPEAIDHAILRKARNEAFTSGVKTGFWQRWMRPLGTVAAMGFCLTLVLQVLDQESAALLDSAQTDSDLLLYESGKQAAEDVKEKADVRMDSASPLPPTVEQPPMPGRAELEDDSPGADFPAGVAASSASAMSPERPAEIQEMVVSRRKVEQKLQDIPESVSAFSAKSTDELETGADTHEDIFVVARKREVDLTLADNALDAWENGARPTAQVWLMGIEELIDMDEAELARTELEKVALVYPEAAEEFSAGLRLRSNEMGSLLALRESAQDSAAGALAVDEIAVGNAADGLADPGVWAEGINRLLDADEDALAVSEVAKFRQIYPDYEL